MGKREDEEIRIICWPPRMLGQVISGTVTRHCRVCLGEVWVAQSTLKFIRRKKISSPYYICVPCSHRLSPRNTGQPLEILGPQPEQIEEINAELKRSKN